MEYKYKNRRIYNSWISLGKKLEEYIEDEKFGRNSSVSYNQWRMLYDMVRALDNQGACAFSPFNLVVSGNQLVIQNAYLAISSVDLDDDIGCGCESNCLTDAEVDELDENIVEITGTCTT